MKKIMFSLVSLFYLLQGCCSKEPPCDPVQPTRINAVFLQNGQKVIPFTKLYAIGGTGALGLASDSKSYDLPVNREAQSTSFIFEKGTQKDTLTLQYNVVNATQDSFCPDFFQTINHTIDFSRTSFEASQLVLNSNSILTTLTITLP